jgi:hypothetical protein
MPITVLPIQSDPGGSGSFSVTAGGFYLHRGMYPQVETAVETYPEVADAIRWLRLACLGPAGTRATANLRAMVRRVAAAEARAVRYLRRRHAATEANPSVRVQSWLADSGAALDHLAWLMAAHGDRAPYRDTASGGAEIVVTSDAFEALDRLEAWDPVLDRIATGGDDPRFDVQITLGRVVRGVSFRFGTSRSPQESTR